MAKEKGEQGENYRPVYEVRRRRERKEGGRTVFLSGLTQHIRIPHQDRSSVRPSQREGNRADNTIPKAKWKTLL